MNTLLISQHHHVYQVSSLRVHDVWGYTGAGWSLDVRICERMRRGGYSLLSLVLTTWRPYEGVTRSSNTTVDRDGFCIDQRCFNIFRKIYKYLEVEIMRLHLDTQDAGLLNYRTITQHSLIFFPPSTHYPPYMYIDVDDRSIYSYA